MISAAGSCRTFTGLGDLDRAVRFSSLCGFYNFNQSSTGVRKFLLVAATEVLIYIAFLHAGVGGELTPAIAQPPVVAASPETVMKSGARFAGILVSMHVLRSLNKCNVI